jgi:TonB-dependent starch-binding outer membrane protein SusC
MCLLLRLSATAQDLRITGKVTDSENGSPVPGVNVLVQGTQRGVNSDANGNYSINVSNAQSVLVFSFVGYTRQNVTVGNRTSINVSLAPDVSSLQEVVVTGYAAQQKRDITGSVAIVDVKELKKLPATNIGDQLQGRVAGVQVSSTGDPGSSAFIRIRGIGTFNQNEPLYIIDGIPVQNESNLNFLNPNDIESMQVLKDAAAASIYGSRAANGVIVVTTKKGKAGVSKINLDLWTGASSPGKYPTMSNPQELLKINQGLAAGAGQVFASNFYINQGGQWRLPDFIVRQSVPAGGFAGGVLSGDPRADASKYFLNSDPTADAGSNYLISRANPNGTDWFREIFNSAQSTNLQLSASGGSDKGNYYLSANYADINGILIYNDFKRYQMRMNSTYNIKKHIRVGEDFSVAYQTTRGSVGNPGEGSVYMNALRMPQAIPVYDVNGGWAGPWGASSNAGNPVAGQWRTQANSGYSIRLTGNVRAEVDFLKHFTAKTLFGVDLNGGLGGGYGYRNFEATEINASNSMGRSVFANRNWVWSNTLAYKNEFGDHRVSGLVGTEARRNTYEGFNASGNGLVFGNDPNYRILTNTNSKTWNLGEYKGEVTVSSLFAQANYSFKDKYLVSGTVRRDGVSRFINNPYGVFPAGSVGWRISQEEFLKSVTFINDLKLRVGYGITGNNEIGSDYPGYANFNQSLGGTAYSIQGSPNSVIPGFAQSSVANADLRWETTKLLNIGVDARLLNALDLSIEWYNRQTTDILLQVPLPSTAGNIGQRPANVGAMDNKGIDLQIGYRGKVGSQFNYGVNLTAGHYTNKVVTLDGTGNTPINGAGSRIGDITRTAIGQPISQYFGYISDGVIKSESELPKTPGDAKVGRLKFRDLNNDGQINDSDLTYIGTPIPKWTYGLNLTANYKNFDFTMFFQGVQGNQIFNYVRYFTDFPAFQANYSKNMLYKAGDTYPKLDANDTYSANRSSFYVESGSYFRAKNLTLGYTLPASLINKVGLDRVRLYVQGTNLFTITKYTGLDPDVTIQNITEGYNSRRDLSMGVDYGRYPISRSVYFGANIEF